jgi:hypothetical protein
MNEVTVTADMATAISAFQNGEFKTFGSKLGEIMTLATVPLTEQELFLY